LDTRTHNLSPRSDGVGPLRLLTHSFRRLRERNRNKGVEREIWREAIRIERITNVFRLLIAAVGASILLFIRDSIPVQSVRAVYIGVGVITGHSILMAIVFFTPLSSNSPWFRAVRYVSSFIDILTISMVLWLLGEYRTFKSHLFLVYFLFIALAAFRYSRPLTHFSAAVITAMYLGMFFVSSLTGRIAVGELAEEYTGSAISVVSIVNKITVVVLVSFIMSGIAKGYSKVIKRVINSERISMHQQEHAQYMRRVLMRYFTKEVAEHIIDGDHSLSGNRCEVTIMFCDFRNFSRLINSMPTEEVVGILNSYLSRMVDVVFAHHGTLDKYTGDGFMAVFGAPIGTENDTLNALYAALEIKACVARTNEKYKDVIAGGLDIGIGISTGEVIAGNIGSEKRLEYTGIGAPVNIAARLEGLNKRLHTSILIADSTYQKADRNVNVKECGAFKIHGLNWGIQVFELLNMR